MRISMLLSNPFRPDPRVLKEAVSLAASGHQVTILAWDRQAELPRNETLAPGVEIQRIHNVRSAYALGAAQMHRLPAFWQSALSHLDNLHPQIVHCHDFDTLPAGLLWGWRHRTPVVYDAHEYYADLVRPRLHGFSGRLIYQAVRWLESCAARRAAAVITVDDTLASRYRKLNPRVLVIGHYPMRAFAPTPALVFTHPELVLVYTGRLSIDRGLLDYVDILRLLRQRGIPARLKLAGVFTPASDEANMRQHAAGLEPWLDVLGWVPYENLFSILFTADVGLALLHPLPRYIAALPVKMFEYMAAGLPVLASAFPPIQAVLEPEAAGAVTPPASPQAAADLLEAWWLEPGLPQQIGRNARQAVLERYNWETLAARLDTLYQSLVPGQA